MANRIVIPGAGLDPKSEAQALYERWGELLDKASSPQAATGAILSLWNLLCAKCGVKDPWDELSRTALAMKEREREFKEAQQRRMV